MLFSTQNLILWLQSFPPEVLWLAMLPVCFGAILTLDRLFGPAGLYAYVVTAILAANIQVLKAVQFSVYPEPVALGTLLFSTSFLATDVLCERYGTSEARTAVLLGFGSYMLFTALMILTIGFSPLTVEQAGPDMAWAVENHDHIAAIFSNSPALLLAGMAAYLTSQFLDIWVFDKMKKATGGRYLWLRNNVSTATSALVDNTVFSLLAWIVLAENPLPLRTVIVVYILGTYWLRLLVALVDTPFMYLACRWNHD